MEHLSVVLTEGVDLDEAAGSGEFSLWMTKVPYPCALCEG